MADQYIVVEEYHRCAPGQCIHRRKRKYKKGRKKAGAISNLR